MRSSLPRTALDESPDEIRQMAEERLDKTISRMGGLAFLYPDAYNGWLEEGYKTAFASYEEMLTFLDSATDASFPDVGELSYVIDPIPADVANSAWLPTSSIPLWTRAVRCASGSTPRTRWI